jgi:hypothetical protein
MECAVVPELLSSQVEIAAVARDLGFVLPPFFDPQLDNPIDEKAAAPYAGVTRRTLQAMRQTGDGPPFMQLTAGKKGRGKITYTVRTILLWRQSKVRRSTSESKAIHDAKPAAKRKAVR